MTKSSHVGTGDQPQNQNNAMSDDPGDGNRTSFVAGDADGKTPAEKEPAADSQDQSTIEAFGKAGAGAAAKDER
jgi:hypothetical protein